LIFGEKMGKKPEKLQFDDYLNKNDGSKKIKYDLKMYF